MIKRSRKSIRAIVTCLALTALVTFVLVGARAQAPIGQPVELLCPTNCYAIPNGFSCCVPCGRLQVTGLSLTSNGCVAITFNSSSYYKYNAWRTANFCTDTWHLVKSNAPMDNFSTTFVDCDVSNVNQFYRIELTW